MTTKSADRRVSRTRRALHEALRSLIVEKGFDHVTVRDVITRADVGRATFYAHFRDKDDLLLSGFEEMRQSLRKTLSVHSRDGLAFTRALFEHAAGHRREYRTRMANRSSSLILPLLQEELTSLVQAQLQEAVARHGNRPAVPSEIVTRYVVSALVEMLTWWLDNNAPYNAEQMAQMVDRMTTPAIAAALDRNL